MTLIEYIELVFEENGILAQLGGRSVPEQHKYAISVANSITHASEENKVSFLQADTGIGKSFGYLVPLMLHVATNPNWGEKKFIISTYTRQLQKQIYSNDVPFLRKVLKALDLPYKQNICFRIGKQGFFSISRVKALCEKITNADPTRKQEMQDFYAAVFDICEYGTGIWADYVEEFGDFPAGVASNDICLLHHQKNDTEAYKLHLEHASLASIIITNHHSILQPQLTGLSEFDVEAVIVDEAHKISAICQEMFNHRLSLNELTHFLNKVLLKEKSLKAEIGTTLAVISELEVALANYPKINAVDFIHVVNAPELYAEQIPVVKNLANLFNLVMRKYSKSVDVNELDNEEAELLSLFESYTVAIDSWLNKKENQYQVSAFGVSSVLKNLSLATLNIRGSYFFGSIIKRITNNVVLTSATLSNAQKNLSFSQVQNQLGLRHHLVAEQLSISPNKYATMRFVLTDKQIPSPVLGFEDDQVIFNPKWLANTVKMIEKAREQNEPLLVLTVSHAESKIIASKLRNLDQVSLHKKGHSIKEYTANFINGHTKVLITSAGWEGLDLRSIDKTQLIKNIVITRIPFAPPNTLFAYALQVIGKTIPNLAAHKKNIEWVDAIQDVVAKLKQGFGRGTRNPDDSVVIWIADSRMPHKQADRNGVLLNAIPDRFFHNYLDAEIFEQKRKDVFFI